MTECGLCGTSIGSMQAHDRDTCSRQRAINERNLSGSQAPCRWCGQRPASFNNAPEFDHKEGCPKR
jgi:hypothetical protein